MTGVKRALVPLAVLTALTGCTGEPEQVTVTETVTADAGEGSIVGPQQAALDQWWESVSTEDQRLLCQYWQDDPDALSEASDRFSDHELPISESVFTDWAGQTCP